jgi:hypothetical protein
MLDAAPIMNLHGSGSTGSVRAADRSRMDDTTGAGDTTTMHRVFSHGLDEPALTFRLPTVDESELVGDWIGRPSPAPLGRWSSRPWVTGAPWRDSSFGTPAHRVRAAVHQGRRIGFVRSFRPSGPDHPRWPGHTDPGLRVLALRVTCEEMDRRENWSRMLWGYSMELFRAPDVRRLLVDPDVEDVDAIQAAQDAGFESLGLFQGGSRTTMLLSARRHQLHSISPVASIPSLAI